MNTVGIILAGGKSTRMKQDKALVKLKNESLLQRQFAMMQGLLGKDNVLVSGDRPGFPSIKDLSPGLGPIEGLRSVCQHLVDQGDERSLLVVPVDMPFITDDGLRRLILHESKSDVTKFSSQQLPALFHDCKRTLTEIDGLKKDARADTSSDFSFKELFCRLAVDDLEVTAKDKFFTNLNTPEDLYAALSQTKHSS